MLKDRSFAPFRARSTFNLQLLDDVYLPCSLRLRLALFCLHHLCVRILVCKAQRGGIKGPPGSIICFSNQQSDANLLFASVSCLGSSLSLHSSLPLCLSQSIQLCAAGMLGVPGEPSSVLAIQTATLHLSTVPGLLKSAMGKARDTYRSTLSNRQRQTGR